MTGGAATSGGGTSGTAGEVLSQVSQTVGEINNSVNFNNDGGVVGGDNGEQDEERKLPVCKG